MIIYEEVKNPGSTKGWEGGKIHICFSNSVLVFLVFFLEERKKCSQDLKVKAA